MTRAHLDSSGLSSNDIRGLVRSGKLERVRRGIYSQPSQLSRYEAHLRLIEAAAMVSDSETVISHVSAGVLHGLPVRNSDLTRVWVTRRSAGHGSKRDHLVVRKSRLDAVETEVVDGILRTDLARTASDLARTSPYSWGVAAYDAALRSGLSRTDLFDALTHHPKLRGLPKARKALQFADERAESPAESMSRVSMHRAGVPPPIPQYEIFDANGEFVARTDFGWPEFKLVGEMDGEAKYSDLLRPGESAAQVLMREKQREEAIRQAGFWPVRWGWNTACDPDALGQLIRRSIHNQSQRI